MREDKSAECIYNISSFIWRSRAQDHRGKKRCMIYIAKKIGFPVREMLTDLKIWQWQMPNGQDNDQNMPLSIEIKL